MREARIEVQSELSLIDEAALSMTKRAGDPERDAMVRLWVYRLIGAGAIGVSGGAIAGLLRNLLREPLPSIRSKSVQPTMLPHVVPDEEDEDKLMKRSAAGDYGGEDIEVPTYRKWHGFPSEHIPSIFKNVADSINYQSGGGVKDEFLPLAGSLASIVAGGVGGYSLVDWLLRKRRAAKLEDKINQARKQYQKALQELSAASSGYFAENDEKQKVASYDFPEMLEDITNIRYDGLEKRALDMPTLPAVLPTLGVLALTLFVVSAVLARSKINRSAKNTRRLKALDSIRRYRVLSKQAPISMVPTAVPIGLSPLDEKDDDDEAS